MHKINIYKEQKRIKLKTTYGILTIDNIDITPEKLEEYCSEILFQKNNLEYIFNKDIVCEDDHISMIELFLPVDVDDDIRYFIEDSITKNNNFYSFFAEALLAVAFKDIYDYKLSSAAVDINDTLIDSHTGADACLYDEQNDVLILGEAKFYKKFSAGLNEIIQNFTAKDGFLNKLSSFYKRSKNNLESRSIIMKSLNKTDITKIKLNEFLSLNIMYAGFVLHEHTGKVEKYTNDEFYNNFEISADKISKNIAKTIGKEIETNHKIILFHLPIKNKMELIDKIIENAQKIRMDIQNENSCK